MPVLRVFFGAFVLLLAPRPVAAAPHLFAQLDPPRAGQRILVIAPHIDDEGLAAAGYVSDALALGAEVFIVHLTAGDHSRSALAANRLTFFAAAPLNRKGQRRIREGQAAARAIGLNEEHVVLLGYPDRGLRRMVLRPDRAVRSSSTGMRSVPYDQALSPGAPYRLESILSDLRAVFHEIQPDIVIAPADQDHHPDHRAAAALLTRVLGELDLAPLRLGYVIHARGVRWSRTAAAADGTWAEYRLAPGTQEKKRQMLAGYRSQRRSPYMHLLFARSRAPRELFMKYPG
ncbi:MAG TPA: PIG-L family deacetylase [Thermoanaerobaculia bacterium]|nr:PIG-L family deacetylase [Thermoanaerobaculia bacterium]